MKYESREFIDIVTKKANIKQHKCPFCGGEKFTTPEHFCTIPMSQDLNDVVLGPHVPAGMIVCENCGHIEFFALGILGIGKNEKDKE